MLAIRAGRELAAETPDRLVSPASVLKVLVSAAALARLGPDYRAETVVAAAATPTDGTLDGDLVVVAGGDPTWNRRFFAAGDDPPSQLARQLAAAGLTHVTGDLVIDTSRFPGRAQPIDRALTELALGYAAPTSALAIDENAVTVRIAPGRAVGAPGGAVLTRAGAGAPALVNEIRTVGPERHDRGTVAFLPLWDRGDILIRGEYPITEPPYTMAVSVPAPSLYAGAAIAAALDAGGIRIDGSVRVQAEPASTKARLAIWRSPPLADWLPPILRDSHNWYAETLLRHLAMADGTEGRIEEGLDAVRAFLLDAVGVPAGSFALADGAGLSADDLVTARTVVATLTWVWSQPWRDRFVAALATPGHGTLESWGRLPAVAAKTGSRRHALALAGYLHPSSTEPVVFAVLLDHALEARAESRRAIAERLRSWSDATSSTHGEDR